MIYTKLPAIARGDSKRFELSVVDSDSVAVDITGWTITMEFVLKRTNATIASSSVTITDGAGGEGYALLTSAQTNVAQTDKYLVTFSRTDSGLETVLAVCEFTILTVQLAGLT